MPILWGPFHSSGILFGAEVVHFAYGSVITVPQSVFHGFVGSRFYTLSWAELAVLAWIRQVPSMDSKVAILARRSVGIWKCMEGKGCC